MNKTTASGVRQNGDDYQCLVAWNQALRSLLPGRRLLRLGLEAPEAGNVDDVTAEYEDRRAEFKQVKFSIDATHPVGLSYLTEITGKTARATSILQKFHKVWTEFHERGPVPRMQLVTNRNIDPHDPVFSKLAGRTSRLGEMLAEPEMSDELASIADHLSVDPDEVLALFADLEFHCGRAYPKEYEDAVDLMDAAGLASDDNSVRLGIDLMRRFVLEGTRVIDRDELTDAIERLGLRVAEPVSVLLVQGIIWDAHPENADETLDWVSHYGGTSPAPRAPVDVDVFETVMHPELLDAAGRILATEPNRVRVRGAMRLATAFTVGTALPNVRNVALEVRQRNQTWSTDTTVRAPVDVERSVVAQLGRGDDLAVVLAITNNLTDDVLSFLAASSLPVGDVVWVAPPGGPGDQSVPSSEAAVALTQSIVATVRAAVRESGSTKAHVFAAAPAGLMLLLGHRWNRVVRTATLYEDMDPGYLPTFVIRT